MRRHRCARRATPLWAMVALSVVGVAMAVTVGGLTPAWAQFEQITGYRVTIVVERNGDLSIDERIAYDFGFSPHHGILRDIPVVYQQRGGKYDRIYRLRVLSVTASGGASAKYDVSRQGFDDEIKIGDANRTITGAHTYDIRYVVQGALNAFPDHDELYWNAVGTEWSVPISNVSVRVTTPGTINRVACYAGPAGSRLPCEDQTFNESGTASFGMSALGPHQAVSVVVGVPKGEVRPEPAPILVERHTLARAFSLNGLTVGVASALLVGFAFLFGSFAWKTGRDRRYVGSAVDVAFGSDGGAEQRVPLFESSRFPVEFEPPEGIRPGEVGTLLDEVAGPLDVSATIVDLAVRGYLKIEEIPKHGLFGKPDWRLTEVKRPDDSLKSYESKLQVALFSSASDAEEGDDGGEGSDGGAGETVLMSKLRTKFAKKLLDVESALYDDVVAQRWFAMRPDKVRRRWAGLGWLVLIAGGVLEFLAVRFTKLALIPVAVIVAGLVMIASAHRMPARTAKGTGVLRRTLAFREFVAHGTEAAKAKFAEKTNLFSEYLPYAIVFGVTEKWAKVFEQLSAQPPTTSWYISPHPFTYAAFASSMDHFTTTASGTIAATPAGSGSSGFGGGGFSGGGGGGGGGGSW